MEQTALYLLVQLENISRWLEAPSARLATGQVVQAAILMAVARAARIQLTLSNLECVVPKQLGYSETTRQTHLPAVLVTLLAKHATALPRISALLAPLAQPLT